MIVPSPLRTALLGAGLSLWLCSACSSTTGLSTAAQSSAPVVPQEGPTYTFERPGGWVRQVQAPGTFEEFTLSSASYSKFKFSLFKHPVDAQGVTPSMAELCAFPDAVHDKLPPTGSYQKSDSTLDGRLCCAATYRVQTLEMRVLTTYVDGAFYTLAYQFEPRPTLDGSELRVVTEMEQLLKSWHWKPAPASPSPTPTPSPSGAPSVAWANFFPVEDGWMWSYRVLLDEASIGYLDVEATVGEGTELLKTDITFEKSWDVSKPVPGHSPHETDTFRASLNGVDRTSGSPTSWLRAPYEVGHAWDVGDHHFVIEHLDETVPAVVATIPGCLKVVETSPDGSTVSRWFSQDFGLVQEITETVDHHKLSVILEDF